MNSTLRERFSDLRAAERTLWAPGPHALSPAVREVLSTYQATYSHRAGEFKDCYRKASELIRELFYVPDTFTPLIFGHTGSYCWEMVAVNTPDDTRAVGMDIGSFSEKWTQVFQSRGRQIHVVRAEWGQGVSAEAWSTELAGGCDLALITHNETSTGVASPLEAMCEAVRAHSPETLIAVDGVSIAGAVDLRIDRVRPDYYLWSLQKDFSIPAIGSVMIVSDRAVETARRVSERGYVLDLVEWAERAEGYQTPMTVPDLTIRCLIARLEEMKAEGSGRAGRHAALAGMQREWAGRHGLKILAAAGSESPTVTAIFLPDGVSGPDFVAAARSLLNVQLAPGYGPTRDGAFRIAAMGATSRDEMARTLKGLSLILDNWTAVKEEMRDQG